VWFADNVQVVMVVDNGDNMITKDDLLKDWNAGGRRITADLLGLVFRPLETEKDRHIHNFVMS